MATSNHTKRVDVKKRTAAKKHTPNKQDEETFLVVHKSVFEPQPPEKLIKYFYPPKPMLPRGLLYRQDVINMLGLTPAAAGRLMTEIRKLGGFPRIRYITVKQFCDYTGVPQTLVNKYLLHS